MTPTRPCGMDNQRYYVRNGALSYELDQEHTDGDLTALEMDLLAGPLDGVRGAVHLCCGAGRHVTAFEERGIPSVGMDISPALLKRAQENTGLPGRLVRGDALFVPLRSGSTDCVTLLGNSLCLFPADRCKGIFEEVRRILIPRGLFILDVPDPSYWASQLHGAGKTTQTIHTHTLGTIHWTWTRRTDPTRRLVVSEEFLRFRDDPTQPARRLRFEFRVYDPEEACSLSEGCGMRPERRFPCEDPSGRYKGMLRKRQLLVFRS